MAVRINKGSALAALSLTPLIDVVFLLLVFFMVVSKFADEDREMDVVLPSASEAKPLTAVPDELFVNIDKNGGFFVDGKTLNLVELEAMLGQSAAQNPNRPVIIRADKDVALQSTVDVMNACNKVGYFSHTLTIDGK